MSRRLAFPPRRVPWRPVLLALLLSGTAFVLLAGPGDPEPPPPGAADPGAAAPGLGPPPAFVPLPGAEALHAPRDVEFGPAGDLLVVDRTATVHRLGLDGALLASYPMPDRERGNPQGLAAAADGRIFVADTHYSRVVVLSSDGALLAAFGTSGEGPGQFVYPTSVALAPDGTVAVAEYGGNDRIQLFSPAFAFLGAFGTYGEEPGNFRRPAGICWGDDGLLYVADSCNHRIQVFDGRGAFIRSFGRYGDQRGALRHPIDVAWSPAGTLVVLEYENNRVQEFSAAGVSLGLLGGPGSAPGRFHSPWGVAAGPGGVVAADTWNGRLQRWARNWDAPRGSGGGAVGRLGAGAAGFAAAGTVR